MGKRSHLNVGNENVYKVFADFDTLQLANPRTLGKWLSQWDSRFTNERPLGSDQGDISADNSSRRSRAKI